MCRAEVFKIGPQICQTHFAESLEGWFFPEGKAAHLTSKESLEIPVIVGDRGWVQVLQHVIISGFTCVWCWRLGISLCTWASIPANTVSLFHACSCALPSTAVSRVWGHPVAPGFFHGHVLMPSSVQHERKGWVPPAPWADQSLRPELRRHSRSPLVAML